MSVITLPRRSDTRERVRPTTKPVTRRPAHRAKATRRRAVITGWMGASTSRRSALIVMTAILISLSGSMLVSSRQIEIHQLQSQLLQDQSSYAVQVGTMTNTSAPSQIAAQAGALHLVEPVVVVQVPSTSLDAPLPLPKFSGSAPATSRTIR